MTDIHFPSPRLHRPFAVVLVTALSAVSLVAAASPASAATIEIDTDPTACLQAAGVTIPASAGLLVSPESESLALTLPIEITSAANALFPSATLTGPGGQAFVDPEFASTGQLMIPLPPQVFDPVNPGAGNLHLYLGASAAGCAYESQPGASYDIEIDFTIVPSEPIEIPVVITRELASYYGTARAFVAGVDPVIGNWGDTIAVSAPDDFFTRGPEFTWDSASVIAELWPYSEIGPNEPLAVTVSPDGVTAWVTLPSAQPSGPFWDGGGRIEVRVASGDDRASVWVPLQLASATLTTSTPGISGLYAIDSTLTAVADWGPAPVFYGYRWLRDGADTGVLSDTYLTTADDVGHQLQVEVTGWRPGFTTAVLLSDPVTILPSTFAATPAPKIVGKMRIGRTVHASVPGWTPAPDALGYQWFRGGKPIVGATGANYKLRWIDFGRKITVQVTGTKAGYETVITKSPARRVWF